MAQLVPSSAAFNSSAPTMQQQQQQQPLLNSSSLSGDGLMLPDFACSPPSSAASPYIPYGLQTNEGQTVPSSPTFSTWNSYSPPSYFSDYSSHHSPSSTSSAVANIKSESVVCDNGNNGNNFQSASLGCDSSLEELLDDYTFDYLYDSSASFVVKEENLTKPKVEVHVEESKSEQQQGNNALLRQCLRPAVNDYEQQRHLQFLNQVGTAAIAAAHNQQQSAQLLVPNMMKTEETSWINNNNNNSNANSAVLSGSGSGIAQQGGYASVHRLVMELGMEEVRSTCEYLGISPNPSQWSVENVRCWLQYTSRQCDLKSIQLERFHVEGCVLASMTEKEFSTRAPQGGEILYAKLFIWRSAWNQRAAMAMSSSSPSNMNKTTPLQTPAVPTIQIDEPCSDMSDTLSCWINNTQDNLQPHQPQQQQQQQQSSSSYMLSVNHHLLAVPSPMSTSSQRSSLSPYSDHTHSCSEGDFASELEEMGEEEDDLMMMMNDDERAGSSASSRNGSRLPMAGAAGVSVGVGVGASTSPNGSHIHLWQFLKELLSQPAQHGSAIRWLDRQRGVFKIEDSVRVAKLWGKRKNRPAMNYDKLSRSIRQYYRKGIMKKTERSQRLVYQFCHPYAL